jgi:signal transduction histidine kinase
VYVCVLVVGFFCFLFCFVLFCFVLQKRCAFKTKRQETVGRGDCQQKKRADNHKRARRRWSAVRKRVSVSSLETRLAIGTAVYVIVVNDNNPEAHNQQLQAHPQNKIAVNMSTTEHQAKINFLSNVSHELRTPMNAIMGFTDLMEQFLLRRKQYPTSEQEYNSSWEELLEMLDVVRNNGAALSALISRLLEFRSRRL